MSMITQRNPQSLLHEFMSWMNTDGGTGIRIEEYVEGDRRVVRADLPGVDPAKDIELTIEGNLLHLSGERRTESHEQHHTEIRYGSFERTISLPSGTTEKDVTADYANGVLTVSMPMKASGKPTRIPVGHPETSDE